MTVLSDKKRVEAQISAARSARNNLTGSLTRVYEKDGAGNAESRARDAVKRVVEIRKKRIRQENGELFEGV